MRQYITCTNLSLPQVIQTGHRYLRALEEREEGGTPAIVGAIRAGLVFQLKAAITPELIMDREQQLFRSAPTRSRELPLGH